MMGIKISEIKMHLHEMNKQDLVKEITELAKLFPEVREYYTLKLNPEAEKEVLEKYKKIIINEFYPDRGFGKLRYSIVNKAIADFKKIANRPEDIADLMLVYAEMGIDFTNDFGDINEKFYKNIFRAYDNALEYIFRNNLQDRFRARAQTAMENSSTIGWGLHEDLQDLFFNSYLEEE